MTLPATLEEGLRFLSSLTRSGIRMGLDRIRDALNALGNPEKDFPALHVAGTNGKGSTCAFAATCLSAGGYRTGLYTSPHLVRVNERIRIDGADISDELLGRRILEVLQRYSQAADEPHPLTYFEFLTLVALWHFSRERVQVAVLETGLGGRLDATNTARTVVAAITPISFDHMEYLGTSLEEIAGEKGGILKPGIPAVISRQPPKAWEVLDRIASQLNAPVWLEGRDFQMEAPSGHYRGRRLSIDGLKLSLRGAHQFQNAAVALACMEALAAAGFPVAAPQMRSALASTKWPARLEQIGSDPPIILDGAHNPAGIAALCTALDELYPGRAIHLVFGVLGDKDFQEMIRQLFPKCRSVHLTPVDNSRSLSPTAYFPQARALCADTHVHASAAEALAEAGRRARPADAIVCSGSLFLVGPLSKRP